MKLKILLMPLSVVLSLVIIIGYIYPSWFGEDANSIKNIKNEIEKKNEELLTVKAKKGNMTKLTQSLQNNADLESLINKYYPTYRNDEDVVNNINNVAFSEGVFLVNMGIEYKKIEASDDPVRVMAIPLKMSNVENNLITPENMNVDGIGGEIPLTDENGVSIADLAKARIKFIEANLEINGNYDQIKRFLVSLNKVGLLNNIKSFEISKKEKQDTVDDEESVSADFLTAKTVIGFGYLISANRPINDLLSSDLFDKGEFNFYDVDSKRSILIGNYKKSEVGEVGISNPFLKEAAAN
ncbi:MAG TPA: hypothetical protein DDY52_04285 [Candidatus Moranbacteria bacterium]|nr:MAG: hypothetical protein UR51_C0009G0028 [Candidatus Moranbacteria bacterium GW2011_GWF1_34_10]HBI17332.1 hypothetical protein [Candidatus Moranbacteria bacterium]